jgi:hypothetical protein
VPFPTKEAAFKAAKKHVDSWHKSAAALPAGEPIPPFGDVVCADSAFVREPDYYQRAEEGALTQARKYKFDV